MRIMPKSFFVKSLIMYLAVSLIVLSTVAGPAEAMLVPATLDRSRDTAAQGERAADLAEIRAALESRIVRQKLTDYGLSPDETMARVDTLSDEQIHQLAAHTDTLQAGGDAVGFLFSALVLAILVVLLIYLIEGRIVIR